ncbi:kinase-like domain-containing protein [Gigaspora rosea]|uniref:Kinase-like domain-containing protein n=1 Tax=Gigaspora rosea TaxID=44941 RepID=A0A397W2V7_9GLOM|nr:kinase-like domain-containing protein [Gigaspora rosea]
MYNEESSLNINNNLSTEWTTDFTFQDQTNINSLNIYNNPSTELSADFTQVYEDQTNNSLPTEWSMELVQDQTTISLPNVYNNPFIEWSTDFSQDQIIELSTKFTHNNPFMEWNADFTQTNTSSLNIYNNTIIKLSAGITQNDEDQTNHNISIEQTTCFAQDRTNTSLHSIYNTEITQHYEAQINDLQQYDAKSVIEDKHPVSFVSRHKKRQGHEVCKKCNRKRILCDKTSKQCRHCYEASLRVLSEFIPYEQFTKIEYLAKGGFSIIYKAKWVDGPITRWCHKKQRYNRIGNHNVVLKILNDSKKMDSDFLNELKNFFNCKKNTRLSSGGVLQQYYGITQHPETKNYIMVIEFAQNRDLHYFLKKNANTLPWTEKLRLLYKISLGLKLVHDNKIIHRDLHSGNILIRHNNEATIADLGISKPVNELSDKNSIYGVIPYVAPEVLKGGKFSQASDIYSFGMIIWEVIIGCRPFSDRKHDEYLILDILNGLRPKIPTNTPQELVEIMERCWHQVPEKRKFIDASGVSIGSDDPSSELGDLIYKTRNRKIIFPENKNTNILPTKIKNQEIYSSRPLTPLISKALTLQSMKLNSNIIMDIQMEIMQQVNNNHADDDSKAIEFDINKCR